LEKKEVSGQEFLLEEIKSMRQAMQRLERRQFGAVRGVSSKTKSRDVDICLGGESQSELDKALDIAQSHPC
jgi:predicted lactoylglutathione lyase